MTEEETGRYDEGEQRASSCHCSRGTRVKVSSSGAFLSPDAENLPGCIAAAEDLSAECGEGSVARSRHHNLPRYPSTASRSGVWKKAGVATIFVGVLAPGTWYPHHPPVFVVRELGLHQNAKAMEPETKCYNKPTRRCILPVATRSTR